MATGGKAAVSRRKPLARSCAWVRESPPPLPGGDSSLSSADLHTGKFSKGLNS